MASKMKSIRLKLVKHLERSPASTLVLMAFCFLGFGYFSLNLFFIFQANVNLIKQYGWMSLQDGAAMQFMEIIFSAFMSVVFYSIWKVCEQLFVNWFINTK